MMYGVNIFTEQIDKTNGDIKQMKCHKSTYPWCIQGLWEIINNIIAGLLEQVVGDPHCQEQCSIVETLNTLLNTR